MCRKHEIEIQGWEKKDRDEVLKEKGNKGDVRETQERKWR